MKTELNLGLECEVSEGDNRVIDRLLIWGLDANTGKIYVSWFMPVTSTSVQISLRRETVKTLLFFCYCRCL